MQPSFVETGLQLFSRLNHRLSLEFLEETLFSNRLRNGETVEISGNVSSGKTFLLTQLLVNCILPSKTIDSVPIRGQNAEAIFIDSDHHFKMSTIIKIIKNKIINSYKLVGKVASEYLITKITKRALDKLTIMNCYDRLQFRLSILSLENMLLHNQKIALVVIDGIAAFYWEDRDQDNIWPKDTYLKYVLNFVQKYTTLLHNVSLIYTISSDFMPADKNYTTWLYCKDTDHRINLIRTNINKFHGVVKSKNCEERIIEYKITEDSWNWI